MANLSNFSLETKPPQKHKIQNGGNVPEQTKAGSAPSAM